MLSAILFSVIFGSISAILLFRLVVSRLNTLEVCILFASLLVAVPAIGVWSAGSVESFLHPKASKSDTQTTQHPPLPPVMADKIPKDNI